MGDSLSSERTDSEFVFFFTSNDIKVDTVLTLDTINFDMRMWIRMGMGPDSHNIHNIFSSLSGEGLQTEQVVDIPEKWVNYFLNAFR